jgi:hypothetical protein
MTFWDFRQENMKFQNSQYEVHQVIPKSTCPKNGWDRRNECPVEEYSDQIMFRRRIFRPEDKILNEDNRADLFPRFDEELCKIVIDPFNLRQIHGDSWLLFKLIFMISKIPALSLLWVDLWWWMIMILARSDLRPIWYSFYSKFWIFFSISSMWKNLKQLETWHSLGKTTKL